ncbi:chaperonin 10-like protein [Aspergillus alliaceus]|uniref:Chaperonin 10-like protein n=1 Tax=Petromyces alliaceus TaxID=209559 RepID=A0A5N7CP07_PETAA|nr:chaperonin 10-like protein [Aspergillus alliaceus]
MRAFEFDDVQSGLLLRSVPHPQPEEGQVIIQVKAAGLCLLDLFTLQDDQYGMILKRPIVLGHEIAGIIVKLGQGVSDPKVGERVSLKAIGLGYDGGYAEQAMAWVDNLIRIPTGVSFAQAVVAADSISTAYHAVITGGRDCAGGTVATVGLGGLGFAAIQIAALQGAKVYGLEIDASKLPLAQKLGAIECAGGLGQCVNIACDTVDDFAGANITTLTALNTAKSTVSIGANLDELKEVLRLIDDGHLCPILEIHFHSIPQGLERLILGRVTWRLFANPSVNGFE